MAAARDASLAHRVVVLPVGLGSRAASVGITLELCNAGNSVLRTESKPTTPLAARVTGAKCPSRFMGEVPVRSLNALFVEPFAVRLMKMDVQGYECNVVRGASRFWDAGCLRSVTAEADVPTLRAQNCTPHELAGLMNSTGSRRVSSKRTCGHCIEKTIVSRATRTAGDAASCPRRR